MEQNSDKTTKQKGRPNVEVSWPEGSFTAQEVFDSVQSKLSRVSVHSKLNKAVFEGKLEIEGKRKSKNGRPRVVYKNKVKNETN